MKFTYRWTGVNLFRIGFSYDIEDKRLLDVAIYLGWVTLYFRRARTKRTVRFSHDTERVWRIGYYGIPDYCGLGRKLHRFDLCLGKWFRESYFNHVPAKVHRRFFQHGVKSHLIGERAAMFIFLETAKESDMSKEEMLALAEKTLEILDAKLEAHDG